MKEITPKLKRVIELICKYPSLSTREISKEIGNSPTAALVLVNRLEKMGILQKVGKNTNKVFIIKDGYKISSDILYFDADLNRRVPPHLELSMNGTS